MKPFSAVYYIKENKKRSMLLMLMIILSFAVYVGGLYISNPYDNWELVIDYYDKIVSMGPNTSDYEAYQWYVDKARESGKVTVIEMGQSNGMDWETVMGFETGRCSFTFRSVDDFKTFCRLMDIECDFSSLKSGSMIMSEKFAKNKGLSLGDKVSKNTDYNIFSEFTLDAVTKEDGYIMYFITDEADTVTGATLIGNGIEGKELYDFANGLQKQLENEKDIYVYQGAEKNLESQFEAFELVYMLVVILVSVILAITINAAFIGMYQRREFEFSVYRAIGISKKRIVGKIAGELILIDLIAIVIGTAVTMLGLYLLNNLVLYPKGQYLRYFNGTALSYMLLCNVIIIVPLIMTRCRQMLKADICEY